LALFAGYERHPVVIALHHRLQRGDPWAVLSASELPAFPTTVIEGYRWVLRGPCLWPLPGVIDRFHDGDPDATAIVETVANGVADDLERGHPKLIVVDRSPSDMMPQGALLELLLAVPRFATLWSGYRLVEQVGDLDLFVPRDQP
jgi:hypothetical protein